MTPAMIGDGSATRFLALDPVMNARRWRVRPRARRTLVARIGFTVFISIISARTDRDNGNSDNTSGRSAVRGVANTLGQQFCIPNPVDCRLRAFARRPRPPSRVCIRNAKLA